MDELRVILTIIGLILLAAIYWMGRRDERRAQEKRSQEQLSQEQLSQEQKAQQSNHETPPCGIDNHWDVDNENALQEDSMDGSLDYDRFYLSDIDRDIFLKPSIKQETTTSAASKSTYTTVPAMTEEAVFVSAAEPAPQIVELPAGIEPLIISLTMMAPQDMTFHPRYLKQTLDDCGMSYGDMNIYHYYRRPISELEPNRGQRLFSIANLLEPGHFDPVDIDTYRTPGVALFLQLPGPIDGVLAFEKMHQMGEVLAKRLSGILCDNKRNKITPQSITHIKDEISEYNLKLRTKLGRTVH